MKPATQSYVFNPNILLWRVLGMWHRNTSSMYYVIYCVVVQMLFLIIFWFLYTLSLMFTPIKLEIFLGQGIYYFTGLASFAKVGIIITRQTDLIKAFKMLDCEEFQGDDVETRQIVDRYKSDYVMFWKTCCILFHFGGFFLLFWPIVEYFLGWSDLFLPQCHYYFLSDEVREKYFILWMICQCMGLYMKLLIDLSIDTFTNGLIWLAIAQFKVLNWKFKNLELTVEEAETVKLENKEYLFANKLRRCLIHYDRIIEYCDHIQGLLDFIHFVSFGTGAGTICVTMLSFFMPMPKGKMLFMLSYTFSLIMEIFVPSRLGTDLTHESQNVVMAIYHSNWLKRSESFKRSFRVFVERARRPIVLTGLKMFTLSVDTFVSIFKMAYSLFTLFRNAQN